MGHRAFDDPGAGLAGAPGQLAISATVVLRGWLSSLGKSAWAVAPLSTHWQYCVSLHSPQQVRSTGRSRTPAREGGKVPVGQYHHARSSRSRSCWTSATALTANGPIATPNIGLWPVVGGDAE